MTPIENKSCGLVSGTRPEVGAGRAPHSDLRMRRTCSNISPAQRTQDTVMVPRSVCGLLRTG